jgi:hypothetical protein
MAKFFHKHRWKIINRNRIGKYLLYAAGEIILVVLGILIALAINNANQNKIMRHKEYTYLLGLQNEFLTSKQKLEELIRVNKANMSGAREILNMIDRNQQDITDKQLSEMLFSTLANDVAYNPNNALLNEMISSGSLKDLNNDTLRLRLTTWIATLEDIEKQENDLHLEREKIIELFRTDEYSVRTMMDLTGISSNVLGLSATVDHESNLDVLNSTTLENNLLFFLLTSRQTEVTHYQPLLHDLEKILDAINRELNLHSERI